jgi:hypothetical protein
MTEAPGVGWMGLFAILLFTLAAACDILGVPLLRTFSVAVTTPTPHAARRLLAVDPKAAKALANFNIGSCHFWTCRPLL